MLKLCLFEWSVIYNIQIFSFFETFTVLRKYLRRVSALFCVAALKHNTAYKFPKESGAQQKLLNKSSCVRSRFNKFGEKSWRVIFAFRGFASGAAAFFSCCRTVSFGVETFKLRAR